MSEKSVPKSCNGLQWCTTYNKAAQFAFKFGIVSRAKNLELWQNRKELVGCELSWSRLRWKEEFEQAMILR